MNTIRNACVGAALVAATMLAGAATTYSGNLGDAGNPALVGSDLGAPDFTDSNAIANNVALYAFTVTVGGTVNVVSTGFAGGGVDPYFSLFAGTGLTATFVDSNYVQATSTGGDFAWTGTLAAGQYEFALGSFENMSFAENSGSGTLGDAFIALGDPSSLHNGSYVVTVTTPVPEPAAFWLLAAGFAVMGTREWRSRRLD